MVSEIESLRISDCINYNEDVCELRRNSKPKITINFTYKTSEQVYIHKRKTINLFSKISWLGQLKIIKLLIIFSILIFRSSSPYCQYNRERFSQGCHHCSADLLRRLRVRNQLSATRRIKAHTCCTNSRTNAVCAPVRGLLHVQHPGWIQGSVNYLPPNYCDRGRSEAQSKRRRVVMVFDCINFLDILSTLCLIDKYSLNIILLKLKNKQILR